VRVFGRGTIKLMLSKRTAATILIILILVVAGLLYFLFFQKPAEQPPVLEKTLEEKLKEITAPAGGIPEVSEEIIKSLTAPTK